MERKAPLKSASGRRHFDLDQLSFSLRTATQRTTYGSAHGPTSTRPLKRLDRAIPMRSSTFHL